MKICIVGGIFGKSEEYREKHALTPETILANGLRRRGLVVDVMGHQKFRPVDCYDLVHVHHLGKGALRMAAARSRSVFVFTSHNGRILCAYERSYIRHFAFRYILKRCDGIVALSAAEANCLAKLSGEGKIIEIIKNGIPEDFFPLKGAKEECNSRVLKVLFVGQLAEVKGVNILFEAIKELRKHWNLELSLAYQNNELEVYFRTLAVRLKIEELVRFIGFIGPRELSRLYREVDLLVLPSLAESLPSVISESLMSGTPVVATRVGGIPEQVGRFGKLAEPGDVESLVAAMDEVIHSLDRYRCLAHEMREYAVANFNVEKMIDDHIRLYQRVLRQNKRKSNLINKLGDKAIEMVLGGGE